MTDPAAAKTVWRLSDGRAGHDSQSRGLCQALAGLQTLDVVDIPTTDCQHSFVDFLLGRFPAGRDLPDPTLIIGAGHRTHWPLLAAKRARGGKTLVLMKPSLPLALFDLCLIPEHDSPPSADNVIETEGALNDVRPEQDKDASLILIMIGGPSRHYEWDSSAVTRQVLQLVNTYHGKNITLTGSPRTPADVFADLRPRLGERARCLDHQQLSREELIKCLVKAAEIWVTMDSVSMIHEALTAGARVGLLQPGMPGSSRVVASVQSLVKRQRVTPFEQWLEQGFSPRQEPFNEAERCARLLFEKGVLAAAS